MVLSLLIGVLLFLQAYSFFQSSLRRGQTKLYSKLPVVSPNIVSIDDFYSDSWKLERVIDTIKNGGIGVLPTDTCYSFVTRIDSKEGVNRLINLKGMQIVFWWTKFFTFITIFSLGIEIAKKPLSLLCKDFSMISKYTSHLSNQKWVFKLFQSIFPGPFTVIMPANGEVNAFIVGSFLLLAASCCQAVTIIVIWVL